MSATAIQAPTTEAMVTNFPLNPTPGIVTVTITGQQGDPDNPLAANLSGSGPGWTTDPQGMQITVAGHYQMTFQMAQGSTFTLFGIQVYYLDSRASNSPNAAIFFPASTTGTAEINLLHDVQNGDSVVYQMFVGIQNADGIFWPDPTISFDPEG